MTKPKIAKRVSTALLNSLGAGVVPRIGLEYIAVGRTKEIAACLQDLDNIAEGGAAFRTIVGRYGAGKSFMLQLIRNHAMERGFVVADVDLSPERRLAGGNRQGVATYRELMRNLATKMRPDGGGLAPKKLPLACKISITLPKAAQPFAPSSGAMEPGKALCCN